MGKQFLIQLVIPQKHVTGVILLHPC